MLLFSLFLRPPHQYWQHCSDTEKQSAVWGPHHSHDLNLSTNHITETFLQFLYLNSEGAARTVLSVPWFPLSHCSYIVCMAVHTENKTHTSGHDLDFCPCSVLVQLCDYLSLSLQWPSCLLSPPWWNDFPTWVRWAWVITASKSHISDSWSCCNKPYLLCLVRFM